MWEGGEAVDFGGDFGGGGGEGERGEGVEFRGGCGWVGVVGRTGQFEVVVDLLGGEEGCGWGQEVQPRVCEGDD